VFADRSRQREATIKTQIGWCVMVASLIGLLWSSPGQAIDYTKTEKLSYCLGEVEFYERFKLLSADRLKNMGRPEKQVSLFRRLAGADRSRADQLKEQLRMLGALSSSGLRADESRYYNAGNRSSQECMSHQISPCVQRCYRAGKGGNGRDEPANCEAVCGLPRACKAAVSCDEFGANS